MNFLEFLVQKKVISQEKAQECLQEIKKTNKKLEEIILEKNFLSENELFELKSLFLKIPLEKGEREITFEHLKIIPESTAETYKMVVLDKEDNLLIIGMVYPEDLKAKEALDFLSRVENFRYKVHLITLSLFHSLLEKYKTPTKKVKEVLEELEKTIGGEPISIAPAMEEVLEEEAPASKMVGVFLRYAVEGEASDIHIEPLKEKTRIRFRRMGTLYTTFLFPKKIHPALVARVKILANLRIDETRIPQDGRFSIKVEGRSIDFRVSTFPTSIGEKVVIRVLDPKVGLRKLEDLGLSGETFLKVKATIERPYGMILVCGPTGSGKTTTLYAILQYLNKEQVNIVTLEDPVEYSIEGINQSQIRPEIGYDFAKGLRHVLRQDPNIIMVGEIRDAETANLAIHAALTGHLVLSTLHTNSAIGAIPRLLDLGVQPFLLPAALTGAIAQRLVKKLCPKCKKKVKAKKEIREILEKEIGELKEIPDPLFLFEPVGCPECNREGFSGRIGIFEFLKMTPELSEVILKEPTETKILEIAKKQKMISMRQDGFLKVLQGLTTFTEVLRVTAE